MKHGRRRGTGAVLAAALLVSLAAGCGSQGTVSFPTKTPQGAGRQVVTDVPAQKQETEKGGAALTVAGSYEKVYEALKKVRNSSWYRQKNVLMVEEATDGGMSGTVFDAVNSPSAVAGADYSKTNVQVEGIDEADIVKTDGAYLYIFNTVRNEIYIVKADGGNMERTATICVEEERYGRGREMYLSDGRLMLVTSGWREDTDAGKERTEETVRYYTEKEVTGLLTYDISDRHAPELLSALEQDGSLVASRFTGGMVYLVTSYDNMWRGAYDLFVIEDGEDYENMPFVREKEKEELLYRAIPQAGGERIAPDCIYISGEPDSEEFLVLTAMSPQEPQRFSDIKSFMAGSGHCYVSGSYIYVGSSRWQTQEIPYDRTELYRFAYDGGVITPAGQVTVKGTLNNQFSMDEYNGYLRIVTTVNEYGTDRADGYDWFSRKESNALYIYDKELQLTGSIEDLAPDEHIESARLLGDTGYFVTFRRTDPLFSVDLSNPAKPEILGELKIPGFSEYLHPYGGNLLLGIGYHADERTGATTGLKLSMFDVSDPSDVKEIHKTVLEEFYYTSVSGVHKAALVDAEKNIIGIPARGSGSRGDYNVYLVFGYDREAGFYQKLSEGYALDWGSDDFYEADFKQMFFSSDCRGLYIRDALYLVNPAYEVRAYDMKSWQQIGREGLVESMEERRKLLERIKEEKPKPLVVELEANPSTGYSWVVTVEGTAVTHSKMESIATEKNMPGAPVTERHTFDVNNTGKAKITFEYERIWESGRPLRTIVYEVSVGEDLKLVTESVTETDEEK